MSAAVRLPHFEVSSQLLPSIRVIARAAARLQPGPLTSEIHLRGPATTVQIDAV
jgi:hypothetical protein